MDSGCEYGVDKCIVRKISSVCCVEIETKIVLETYNHYGQSSTFIFPFGSDMKIALFFEISDLENILVDTSHDNVEISICSPKVLAPEQGTNFVEIVAKSLQAIEAQLWKFSTPYHRMRLLPLNNHSILFFLPPVAIRQFRHRLTIKSTASRIFTLPEGMKAKKKNSKPC